MGVCVRVRLCACVIVASSQRSHLLATNDWADAMGPSRPGGSSGSSDVSPFQPFTGAAVRMTGDGRVARLDGASDRAVCSSSCPRPPVRVPVLGSANKLTRWIHAQSGAL